MPCEFGEVVFDGPELGEERDALLVGELRVEAARPLRVWRLHEPAAFRRGGLAHVAARDERGLDALYFVVEPREVGVDAVAGVVEDLAETPFVDAPQRVDALQLQRLGALLEDVRAALPERPRVEAQSFRG